MITDIGILILLIGQLIMLVRLGDILRILTDEDKNRGISKDS
jgi:hypothetical protein